MNIKDEGLESKLLEKMEGEKVLKEIYVFDSQKWPVGNYEDIPTTVWKHRIVIYTPKDLQHKTALLFVGGGQNRSDKGENEFSAPKEALDFKKIAIENKAVVISLEDVPNQFLMMDGVYKKEDKILAYTYKKFMEDPMKNAYLAGHLPMAKAIVKAMDFVENLRQKKTRFVLTGASKRGWAIWLSAIADDRVDAMIPIVIDVLNTQKSMEHICTVFEGCPVAMTDYKKEDIPSKLNTEEFANLMKIEDPLSYLGLEKYKERFEIPKYIINASGDDFFLPDSSKWYFDKLPGETYLRYLPNSMHYFSGSDLAEFTGAKALIQQSCEDFFFFHLNKEELPKLSWSLFKGQIEARSSLKPDKVKLWTAFNAENRDFSLQNLQHRFAWGDVLGFLSFKFKDLLAGLYLEYDWLRSMISHSEVFSMLFYTIYHSKEIEWSCSRNNCSDSVLLHNVKRKSGWHASFLEFEYSIAGKKLVLTTEVLIDYVK